MSVGVTRKNLKTKAMKTQITIKGIGLLAILFLLALVYNTVLACCPCETNINTLQDPGVESDFAGDPINLVSGKVLLEEKDLVLQTPILGLEFIKCENDVAAFIKEYELLRDFGGPKSARVYNIRQSPGKKLKGD